MKKNEEKNGKKYGTLATRFLWATVLSVLVPGVATLIIGLSLYRSALLHRYVTDYSGLCRGIATYLEADTDIADLSREIYGVYRDMSQLERDQMETDAYRARFAHAEASPAYKTSFSVLQEFGAACHVTYLYIATFDRETEAVVYIADPDIVPEEKEGPGDWEPYDREAIELFLSWDGEGELYEDDVTEAYGWTCTTGAPIRDASGQIVAFVLADVTLENIRDGMRGFTAWFVGTLAVVMALTAYIITRRTKKRMVQPLVAMSHAAEEFVEEKKTGAGAEHFAALNIHTGDEIEKLGVAMANMEQELTEYEKSLTSAIAEKERIGTELAMAASIQSSMLPSIFPAFPDREEFSIFASMDPAKEVGGDFYDFFMIDGDHLAMVMADVSGKGVPAALFMMTVRTMLKGTAQAGLSPARVLAHVNGQICENNPEYMFVTVWMGQLELSTGKLTWADAGHDPMVLYRGGRWELQPKKGGIALGFLDPDQLPPDAFTDRELILQPGDGLFQYTDGVTEAMTADLDQFGYDRMVSALGSSPSADPEALLPHLRQQIDAFVRGADQFDDITMLGMRYHGPTRGDDVQK